MVDKATPKQAMSKIYGADLGLRFLQQLEFFLQELRPQHLVQSTETQGLMDAHVNVRQDR